MPNQKELGQSTPIPKPIVLDENTHLISNADGSKEIISNNESLPCTIKYRKPDRFGRYGGWAIELKIPDTSSAVNTVRAFTLDLQYNTETNRWSIKPDTYFCSDLINRTVTITSLWNGSVGGESSDTNYARRRKDRADKYIHEFLEKYEQLAIKAISCLDEK